MQHDNAQADLLLPDDDPSLATELARRTKAASGGRGSGSGGATWKESHSKLAEQYGVQWPLAPSKELLESKWFHVLPDREKEVSCFLITDRHGPSQTRVVASSFVTGNWISCLPCCTDEA